ncbi:MAG: ribonuclease HII [Spirochaetes bacterium]|nr:ribonuclease HII [Spirochaetota bacterium]
MKICGVDEAGRGPLAGPVVAAAVILPSDRFPIERLKDSKALSDKERRSLCALIKDRAFWCIGEASPEEIDAINILRASLLAMKRAVEGLPFLPDRVLVDGLFVPDVNVSCEAIVGGDTKIPEIMAASILAKTYRDDLMIQWGRVYPQYGFEHHKGYPTKAHRAALMKWGPSPIHRRSFRLIYAS